MFMGLPQVTREVLRSQPVVGDTEPGDERTERDRSLDRSNLLPTQPPRPAQQDVDKPAEDATDEVQGRVPVHPTPRVSSSSGLPAAAPASTMVVKRPPSPNAKKNKRRKTHAWDCTGLVPRYTDAKDVPARLKKCETYQPKLTQTSTNGTRCSRRTRASRCYWTKRGGTASHRR